MHVLFPDEYRASARMVAQDFAFFGSIIVLGVLALVLFPHAL